MPENKSPAAGAKDPPVLRVGQTVEKGVCFLPVKRLSCPAGQGISPTEPLHIQKSTKQRFLCKFGGAAGVNARPTERGNMAVNREDANPALLQTFVGDDACIVPGAPVLPQTPTGGPWPSPTNRAGARSWPGKREPAL